MALQTVWKKDPFGNFHSTQEKGHPHGPPALLEEGAPHGARSTWKKEHPMDTPLVQEKGHPMAPLPTGKEAPHGLPQPTW